MSSIAKKSFNFKRIEEFRVLVYFGNKIVDKKFCSDLATLRLKGFFWLLLFSVEKKIKKKEPI
jgi:hypothetical protein